MTGPMLSPEDVNSLRSESKTVLIVSGDVYAIDKSFKHPGGRELLDEHDGSDVTSLFYGTNKDGHAHSKAAKELLKTFYVGRLSQATMHRQQEGESNKTDVASTQTGFSIIDESKPLLWQVGKLGNGYMDWVHTPSPIHPRFFQSDWAESLTKVHWWMVPLIWIPTAVFQMFRAIKGGNFSSLEFTGLVALGVVLWLLIEYSLHRFIFHIKPTQPKGIFLHFLLHGCHHKYPMDTDRLLFPPVPASLIAAVINLALHAVFPHFIAMAVFGGILLGYTAYDLLHWGMHSGIISGPLKSAHMHHHFIDSDSGYGISAPLFDWLLGTLPNKSLGESSNTTRRKDIKESDFIDIHAYSSQAIELDKNKQI